MQLSELLDLPSVEKLKIMEALWENLAAEEQNLPDWVWHEEELRKAETKYLTGNQAAVDWQHAKQILSAKFE